MQLKEIYDKKWNINKNLEINWFRYSSIPKEEQECHFNVIKQGFNSQTTEILFCCSYQEYITKLSKSQFVTVNEVLICSINDFVLQVSGSLGKKGLSIRNKVVKLSSERKKSLAQQLMAGKQQKRFKHGD